MTIDDFYSTKYEDCRAWAVHCLPDWASEDAEDIITDVYIYFKERSIALDPDTAKTLVFEAIKHRCLNAQRDAATRAQSIRDNAAQIQSGLGQRDSNAALPLDEVIADEEMNTRLKELSPILYDTLDAYVNHGMTPEEIARAEGTSANVIYQRIFKAKKILQGNINE